MSRFDDGADKHARSREPLQLDPNNAQLRDRLKATLQERAWELATDTTPSSRDPARAMALAEEALVLAPRDANCWHTLGVARYRSGNFDDAIVALQKYRDLRSDDSEWSNPFFLAMAHWQLGNKDEARSWYDKGAQWMDKQPSRSKILIRFRSEAAQLLGVNEKK